MAFQISYVFEFKDKYSKTATQLIKCIGDIERRIKKSGKGFKDFAAMANTSLNSVAVRSNKVKKSIESINRSQLKANNRFKDFSKSARQSTSEMRKILDMLNKSIKKTTREMNAFQRVSGKGFKEFRAEALRAEVAQTKFRKSTKKTTAIAKMQSAVFGNLKFRIASMLVTMGMTGFGIRQLIDKATKIEKSFTVMSALTGITGKDFEFLEKKAFQFARVFGVSMEDVATSFKRVAGLKPELIKDVKALAELTKWTLILDAPMEQIEKISRALTIALNVYGKSAKSAGEFTNILAAAQRKGSAEVIDMAMSFLKTGPIARAASVPFIELISVIQGLARAGVLSRIAGTSLRTVMIRVARQAKNQGDTFMSVLKRLATELNVTDGGLGDIARAAEIFGVRQAHASIEIMKAIPLIEEFRKEIKNTNIAVETANKIMTLYERQLKSIWAVWDREVKQTFEEIKPEMLGLHKQWVAFITQLSMALPGGAKSWIEFFIELAVLVLKVANAVLLIWNILTSPFALAKGWDNFLKRMEAIRDVAELAFPTSPIKKSDLDEIAGEEGKAGKPGAAGRVKFDINLRGNTEAVESASVETEGDMDFDTGVNFAV